MSFEAAASPRLQRVMGKRWPEFDEQECLLLNNTTRVAIMTATNFFTGGMLSTNISVLATLLREDIGLTSGQFGVIFAMSGIVTGLLGAIPGMLIDRIGPKRGMILGYLLAWTPMALFPFIKTPPLVFVALFFTAFGSALNMPSTSAIVKALKITNFSKILGVNIVAHSVGAFITQTFAARLIPVLGGSWRNVIWLFAGITFVFGIFAIFTISKVEIEQVAPISTGKGKDKSVKVPKECNRSMWSLAVLYAGTMGTSVAVSSWLPTLMAERGYDTITSGTIASFQTVGALATALLVPVLFEKLLHNTITTPVAGLAVLGIVMTILSSQSLNLIKAAALCAGIAFNFLSLHAQRDIISSAPEHVSGKYVSTINACANCSGVMSVMGIGMLTTSTGKLLYLCCFACLILIGGLLYRSAYRAAQQQEAQPASVN